MRFLKSKFSGKKDEFFKRMFFFVLLGFVSDCVYGNKTKSYSLRDFDGIPLDRKLISKMKMSGGFFIEAGAHDGVTQSNTKLLE